MSGKSIPHSDLIVKVQEQVEMEVVEELLIKIQEEETAMVISCAKAKAASDKVEATALAKKSETVAEAALKIAAADGRLAQVEEEAKRKEIEIKKRSVLKT